MLRQSRRIGIKEKLQFIKDAVSGVLPEEKPEPRFYNAIIEKGVITVTEGFAPKDHEERKLIMNQDEFATFKLLLNSNDILFILCDSSDKPIDDDDPNTLAIEWNEGRNYEPTANELLRNYEAHKKRKTPIKVQTVAEEIEAVKSPVNSLRIDAPIEEENVLISVPRRSGKISEYGITWGLKSKEYNLS